MSLTTKASEALAWCAEQPFDVILCDLQTPTLNGEDFYRELAHQGNSQEKRVVFMTAGNVSPRVGEFVRHVPNSVLHKPFALHEVQALVRAVEPCAAP